jgi:DNA polymerase III subunit epsilon
MRAVVLDTETTGLEPREGHRVVEIGAVELNNHIATGRTFHTYLNPERDVPEDARRIHGLDNGFLESHPRFSDIADELLAFLEDSPLVIHNASFDLRFLNAELSRIDRPPLAMDRAVDTLLLAQRRFPGGPNNLDALCRRFGVDGSARTLHGALLDCELLAEVYLHLIGGRQPDLGLATSRRRVAAARRTPRPPRPHAPGPEELAAHEAFLDKLTDPLWRR